MKRSEREAAAVGSHHLLRVSHTSGRPKEAFEGAEMVHEVAIGQALLLIEAYRSVMSWALAVPADHDEIFAPEAAGEMRELLRVTPMHDVLRAELEAICELLANPVGMSPARVTETCVRIAEWAERRGDAPATAFRFMQAAGMCAPNDARLAYRAGSMARQRGIWDLAELWFRHAIAVGRRTRDWEGHALAYVGLGYSYYLQDRHSLARREQLKALRVATRHGLRGVRAKALHDLFAIAITTNEFSLAERYGREAFYAYGPTHSAIPGLAHDMAYFWSMQGKFQRSIAVYRALLRHVSQPTMRLRVLASLGRATGGVGDRAGFLAVWNEAWSLIPELEGDLVLSTSLLELAYGAASLGERSHVETAAGRALELARERNESDVLNESEQLLASAVVGRQTYDINLARTESAHEDADSLVADLVGALEGAAP